MLCTSQSRSPGKTPHLHGRIETYNSGKERMQHSFLYRPHVPTGINTSCVKGIISWKAIQPPVSIITSAILLCPFTLPLLVTNACFHGQKYFHSTAAGAALFHWAWPSSSHGEITLKQKGECACRPSETNLCAFIFLQDNFYILLLQCLFAWPKDPRSQRDINFGNFVFC